MLKRNYVKVARDLASVTRIAPECDARDAGLSRSAVDAIWSAVQKFYQTGVHPAITIQIRRRGQIVLHRAIGHVRGNEPLARADEVRIPAVPETPICLFSASKAITAVLVHMLVDKGWVRLDDRVADYIPEFAANGKGRTTIRQLLAHRAGIPAIPGKNLDHALLYDWDATVAMLCAARPFEATGEKQAYHAITSGFILGELVQRVSGLSLGEALRLWLAEPLACRHLTYGLPPEHRHLGAPNVLTGPRPPWAVDLVAKKVLGAGFRKVVEISNEEGFLNAAIPSANLYATADDVVRVFQMLLNGGILDGCRVLRPETVAELVKPVGHQQLDGTLIIPLRFSAGMMLGDYPFGLFGPSSRNSYGHLGFLNVVAWADPVRDVSCAILANGKSVAPSSFLRLMGVMSAINAQCRAITN